MIYEIPLKPVPSQQTTVGIEGRDITVAVRLRLGRLYADVKADGEYWFKTASAWTACRW